MADINLSNWEGIYTSSSIVSGTVTHTIKGTIPANKLIAVSLENIDGSSNGANISIGSLKKYGGGDNPTRYCYFKTTAQILDPKLTIAFASPCKYRVYISVVNAISKFTPADCFGIAGSAATNTFMYSNDPEELDDGATQK